MRRGRRVKEGTQIGDLETKADRWLSCPGRVMEWRPRVMHRKAVAIGWLGSDTYFG